jgi:hypothetical protein
MTTACDECRVGKLPHRPTCSRAMFPDNAAALSRAALAPPARPGPPFVHTLTGDFPAIPAVTAAEMGRKGGAARAARLTPEQRQESARKAAKARWGAKP